MDCHTCWDWLERTLIGPVKMSNCVTEEIHYQLDSVYSTESLGQADGVQVHFNLPIQGRGARWWG